MSQDTLKQQAAQAALDWILQSDIPSLCLGIGTGSTVNHFIDILDPLIERIDSIVSSSLASSQKLRDKGLHVQDNNTVVKLDLYIDGADEINARGEMIKGGGGAQTGEKILACLADRLVCIADAGKQVDTLGRFPVAVEVLKGARSYVSRQIVSTFQAQPELRQGFVTDYNNVILDVYNLDLTHAKSVEERLNAITGVVENGIFSHNRANLAFIAHDQGVTQLHLDR